LHSHWERFRKHYRTKTRDTSEHALAYMKGQMTMDANRHMAGIANSIEGGGDGQAMHHFVSISPWEGNGVYEQIQDELKEQEELRQDGFLIVDEYADEKAGVKSAGSARQYNGRFGKVDECQVAVAVGYANWKLQPWPMWALIDAEIYLPEIWYSEKYAEEWKRVGIPAERAVYESKLDLALKMVLRAKTRGVAFEAVLCDDLYGRSSKFRRELGEKEMKYMADIPCNLRVYLEKPEIGIPQAKPGQKGPKPQQKKVINGVRSYSVEQVGKAVDTTWQLLRIRNNEHGILEDRFAARLVWVWDAEQPEIEPHQEWLVMRIESNGDHTYAFSNAPQDASLQLLAEWLCGRYFVERIIEDGKDELGADEFMAQKYRAWQHHTALTACALWFIALTKLDWAKTQPRDPELLRQLELEVLPALSTANVRQMLKAVFPLPQLTIQEAQRQVVRHLVNRSRSTASRLRHRAISET
jgi:SRSO17 transposase